MAAWRPIAVIGIVVAVKATDSRTVAFSSIPHFASLHSSGLQAAANKHGLERRPRFAME